MTSPLRLAFDVFHNDQRLCTAGLGGDAGVISINVTYIERSREESLSLSVTGLKSSNKQDHILWSLQQLEVGDEVKVRISEESKLSEPSDLYRLSSKSRDDQELDWLRKTAKRRGYRLVKGTRGLIGSKSGP